MARITQSFAARMELKSPGEQVCVDRAACSVTQVLEKEEGESAEEDVSVISGFTETQTTERETQSSRPTGSFTMTESPRSEGEREEPVVTDGEGKREPVVADGEGKREPAVTDGEGKEEPVVTDGEGKEEPVVTDGEGKREPVVTDGEGKREPVVTDGEGKREPVVTDGEGKREPVVTDGEGKREPVVTDGEGKREPVVTDGEGKREPVVTDGEGKREPVVTDGEGKREPVVTDGEGKREPVVTDGEGKREPVVTDGEGKREPVIVSEAVGEEKSVEPVSKELMNTHILQKIDSKLDAASNGMSGSTEVTGVNRYVNSTDLQCIIHGWLLERGWLSWWWQMRCCLLRF